MNLLIQFVQNLPHCYLLVSSPLLTRKIPDINRFSIKSTLILPFSNFPLFLVITRRIFVSFNLCYAYNIWKPTSDLNLDTNTAV